MPIEYPDCLIIVHANKKASTRPALGGREPLVAEYGGWETVAPSVFPASPEEMASRPYPGMRYGNWSRSLLQA